MLTAITSISLRDFEFFDTSLTLIVAAISW
jgi:hypothetical protein